MRPTCLVIAAALLSPLLGAASGSLPQSQKAASIFSDLTPEELQAVRSFLMNCPELGLQPNSRGTLSKNSLFLVELQAPRKSQALRYLDFGGSRPRRLARAVVFFGAEAKPNATEYIVGPLPTPTFYRRSGQPVAYASRPMTQLEHRLLHSQLRVSLAPLEQFLQDVSGFGLEQCGGRCLTFTDVAPRGLEPGERQTWIMLQREVEGFFLHPVGLELLIDHRALDPDAWKVQKVWYNGQYFDSPEELAEQYAQGQVETVALPKHPEHSLFSTFVPRGNFTTGPPTDVHGAKICEPDGHRYDVRGNLLQYSGWSLAFRLRSSTGLQLFDVRFNGERIAYELSVQEAVAFYGGITPAAMQTKYIDVGWGMGSVTHELAPGVDCPEVATFLDAYHMYDVDGPVRYPRAICVFEMPTGVPMRRHFDSNFHGGSNFYGGLEGHALVLRTTSTVYNYDYIWDFLLFPNGVLETKVHATGYVHASFYTPEGIRYGSRIQAHVLGNMHTHLVHYKVDLDIAGTGNSFETLDLSFEDLPVPWKASERLVQPFLERQPRLRERQAAFPFGKPLPRYLLFSNPTKNNCWGHQRSYRIQPNSHGHRILPRNWKEERGVSWTRYHLAVTRHHEKEDTSSSIYIQNNPWQPTVAFENFLQDDESLDTQDLVAWVTVGFLHIPHSEDVPNTSTPGNAVGFFLRPFNFFDEDPSVASRRTVIVRPNKSAVNKVTVQRWTPDRPRSCISDRPFSYDGTYSQV
ncbi:amiloride-sensitive amine oxidase [copper-containing] [Eublepharis macularius]|uniref:Amine oxidase n=1 Tax=Eublepharis macularius TaxID=481883 RepID=A0AA97LAH6_EUBMA|nr:amiloride-sensitive amine oxidase [copper-containing] [Eublepharis macularius]XP_054847620.1 amiloride-sensitive amine oxidase [copper-containing] [Eublepharis macularius]XP_054847621.1 amiloride-sensitive amine oxidase [copper-containing] [Eublepharis macularius]XP_054847622.1 amiloride-sensitive amine oxidase [copper-containing] [Eublepharis macularius]